MSQTIAGEALDARAQQAQRTSLWRKPLVPATALVIAGATAVSIALGYGGHPRRSSAIGSPAGAATFNGLTLRFPAAWHAVQPTFITAAIIQPLGWITNAQPGPQCTAGRTGHVGCHGPVTHLGSSIVQISLQTGGGSPDFTRQLVVNSRLAGLPAQRNDGTTDCDRSAVNGFTITAAATPTSVVRLTACFGPNTSAQQTQVQEMLDTASYRHP